MFTAIILYYAGLLQRAPILLIILLPLLPVLLIGALLIAILRR